MPPKNSPNTKTTPEANEPVPTPATPEPAEATEATDEVTAPEAADAPADTAPADNEAADSAATATEDSAGGVAASPAKHSLRVPALLAVVIVLLGGFGVWASLKASSLRSSNAGQNVALADAAATSAVRHQVSSAVNQIFSYRYTDTAATRRAAQGLLTGKAIEQYNRLFSLVEKEAPIQKLVVTTTVTNSGVEFLSGDQARVLIFANQQDTRAGTSQSSYAGAMFAVTAIRIGTHWKIGNINPFTGN